MAVDHAAGDPHSGYGQSVGPIDFLLTHFILTITNYHDWLLVSGVVNGFQVGRSATSTVTPVLI